MDKFLQIVGKIYVLLYRFLFVRFQIGKNSKVWGKIYVVLYGNGRISIGDNCRIVSSAIRSGMSIFSKAKFTAYDSGRITIENNVSMSGTTITSKKKVVIGEHTMISPNVIIIDTDFHSLWPPEERFNLCDSKLDKEVVIGKNVWIGSNSIILKGTIIGDNSIIGAGSVVSNDIPANSLAAGNPAKVIRSLTMDDSL